ncbi:MAG: hypothetical protein HLUCCA11_22050 [Phormidesmis priestleyi Ana]|uniref:Uncharacterized protein n=1 Tax=Phormidesmis priestleyi Ana TaxID=1666911 RepID=A0A0P7ZHI9_9CYAN|nr:MAG: hypothetical protein HLUCCA11_22050 [Phormidesmis priestleyi Ana]
MTLFRNVTSELTLVGLMVIAGQTQAVKAQVSIQTESSLIETGAHGVYIQTASPESGRPPLNSAHPLFRVQQPAPVPDSSVSDRSAEQISDQVSDSTDQCSSRQVHSSQHIHTNHSGGSHTHYQSQTISCQ